MQNTIHSTRSDLDYQYVDRYLIYGIVCKKKEICRYHQTCVFCFHLCTTIFNKDLFDWYSKKETTHAHTHTLWVMLIVVVEKLVVSMSRWFCNWCVCSYFFIGWLDVLSLLWD